MEIISQNYDNVLKELIIKNFSSLIKDNIFRENGKNKVYNYIDLLSYIDEKLCELAKSSLIDIFNAIDKGFKNSSERRHRFHIKSHQERTILTIFGEITIKRTFYKNRFNDSSYCYLDDYLGLKKYDYFDPYIKALIIDYAANNSFGKVSKYINDLIGNRIKLENPISYISKQTVRNIILEAKISNPEITKKETPETIYIMADEKFIATQNNNNEDIMVKSIVIFEDREFINYRFALKNKMIFSSFNNYNYLDDSLDYLYQTYEIDKIKTIYVMGDGASWIKSLKNQYKFNKETKVIFALDKFHFMQSIHYICLNSDLEYILSSYVINNYKNNFIKFCDILINNNPNRIETINKNKDYILNNWNYIRNLYKYNLKCPMESQISHNIADLFSSRPKAYSLKTFDKLLILRLLYKNNFNIKQLYLNNYNKKDILTINQDILNIDNNQISLFRPKFHIIKNYLR